MESSWHSYPSIYNLGHKAVADLLNEPVLVEEKIDGSQFSFGWFPGSPFGAMRCRSKGADIHVLAPDTMFNKAVQTVLDLEALLHDGWTYRAEYLMKPHHNVLTYDRAPVRSLIIFDINPGEEQYLSYDEKVTEAVRLGLEVVPRLFEGMVTDVQQFREMLDQVSCLGGQKIEGLVVKNYQRFGLDKKVLMGKFVSEKFKEVHAKVWKSENPTSGDILDRLIDKYKTPARWQKALQHLREAGQIDDSPRDIGLLIREVAPDVEKECIDEIKDLLWQWAWPRVRRGLTAGLPEWYKELLMELQFEKPTDSGSGPDVNRVGGANA